MIIQYLKAYMMLQLRGLSLDREVEHQILQIKPSLKTMKICCQCGKKYDNRGKICEECFKSNGGKVKK